MPEKVKGIDDIGNMPEFQCGLWCSPHVKIYTIGGPNRIAEVSTYPRAYKDTTPHVYTEDVPYIVGVEDLPHPVDRFFKTYPGITPDMEGLMVQGACNGCSRCYQLWSSVRNVRHSIAEIKAGIDAVMQRTDAVNRWFLTWLAPAECGWDLFRNGELAEPTIARTETSPDVKECRPVDEQVYTDSRGIEYHVGEQAVIYAGTPLPGAFPLWIESEDIPFTADQEKHVFPILGIPGPVKGLAEAGRKVGAAFVKLPEQAVANMRGELATGKITLSRKPADLDKQIIRIKYQRVF